MKGNTRRRFALGDAQGCAVFPKATISRKRNCMSKSRKDARFAAVWGLSVLTLVFGMSLALAGCGGDDGGDDDTKKDTGSTELAGTIHISEADEYATDRPAVTETDPGIKLYAVYSEKTYPTYQWNKDEKAIPDATKEEYTPAETGSYTVTVTKDGKSKTSAAVTVSTATAATVSVGVDVWALNNNPKYIGYVTVTLTLSRGTWKSDVNDTSDSTTKATFKAATTLSRYNDWEPRLEVDTANPRKVTCTYNGGDQFPNKPTGEVTVTLESTLAALAQYTTLGSPATLTAGNPSTASDSDWEVK